jgi:hypothetical protein
MSPALARADEVIERCGYLRNCSGFWTPAITRRPQAQLAGVQKASMHEPDQLWPSRDVR